MKNSLRYFYRLDIRLRPVLGSLIARASRPRNGRWKELVPETCCNRTIVPVLSGDPASIADGGDLRYELRDAAGILASHSQVFTTDLTTTLLAITAYLNSTYPMLALFSLSGYQILVKPQKGQDATNWQASQIFSPVSPLMHAPATDLPEGN